MLHEARFAALTVSLLAVFTSSGLTYACVVDEDCSDDSLFCTGPEICDEGFCVSAGDPCLPGETCDETFDVCTCTSDPDCDDSNVCTDDTCAADSCVHTSNFNPCDDGDACTVGDVCSTGVCGGSVVDCSAAGDDCNDASCNPGGLEGNCDTLTPVNEGAACADGLVCTNGETCSSGFCTGTAVCGLPPERTGNFYVGNFGGDNVLVYDSSGSFLRSFTETGLTDTRGVAYAPNGRFYVASQGTDEIFIFDREEQFVDKFTTVELDGPTGLAVSNADELYVASFDNDRVVVFDLDGNYVRDFTGGGMNGPNCVAFDSAGDFYVSSALTANVLKFSSAESFLFSFTGGGLLSPMSIARDTNDVLYVSGGSSNNIVKFNTDGDFLGTITHPDLPAPQGIAFDDRGHWFSSSFSAHKIVEFDENDSYVQTITAGGLNVPRSLAFYRGSTIYVDADAIDLPADGATWCSAWRYLQDALPVALAGDVILVANGVYHPDEGGGETPGDRSASFEMKSGVAVYGGFAGCGAPDPDDRDIVNNETVLSGDLAADDDPGDFPDGPTFSDNSYHVVRGIGVDETAVLDGFTCEAGNANNFAVNPEDRGAGILGGSATIRRCIIQGHYAELGAGGSFGGGETPVFIQCTIRNNIADGSGGGLRFRGPAGGGTITNCILDNNSSTVSIGGGLHSNECDLTFVNSIFHDNTSTGGGAASFNNNSTAEIVGCTFVGNTSTTTGGGIVLQTGAAAVITNSILWGNSDSFGMDESAQIAVTGASAAVNYSIVEGTWTGDGGIGNGAGDPLFADEAGGDLRLRDGSPAIDTGSSQALLDDLADLDGDGITDEPTPRDFDGNSRTIDDLLTPDTGGPGVPVTDMGIYEFFRDCNEDTIPDSEQIASGDSNDCNFNGVLDECDDPIDDTPDECVNWQGGATGDFSDPPNWPGGVVPDFEDSVTIAGGVLVTVDADAAVGTLRLLDNSTLEVTGETQGDLTILGTGGLLLEGTLLIDHDRAVDVSSGAVVIGLAGSYQADPNATGPVSASLDAGRLTVLPGACDGSLSGGVLALEGDMTVNIAGHLRLEGTNETSCSGVAERGSSTARRRGIIPPPKVEITETSSVVIAGNYTVAGAVESNNSSDVGMLLAGDFINGSQYPSLFDWVEGRLEMNGTDPQIFEVGGIDFGVSEEGFLTDEDTPYDTDRHTNFAIGTVQIGTDGHASNVTFVNGFANTVLEGACQEALYVDTLVLKAGSSITLKDCRVYYHNLVEEADAEIFTSGCGELVDLLCSPSAPVAETVPLAGVAAAMGTGAINTKNRVISIMTSDVGFTQAIRVRFVDLPPAFDAWEYEDPARIGPGDYFVGEPFQVCENSGQGADVSAPGECGAAGELSPIWYWAAKLECNEAYAHLMNWHGACVNGTCVGGLKRAADGVLPASCSVDEDCVEVIHLFHEGLVPEGIYHVQTINDGCSLGEEAGYSDPLMVTQGLWGDVCGPSPGGACTSVADGLVEVANDVLGILDKFANTNGLQKAQADLEPGDDGSTGGTNNGPDLKVNVANDVLFALEAFQGFPYPFGPGDPCDPG